MTVLFTGWLLEGETKERLAEMVCELRAELDAKDALISSMKARERAGEQEACELRVHLAQARGHNGAGVNDNYQDGPHPGYGPCDAFGPGGSCVMCSDIMKAARQEVWERCAELADQYASVNLEMAGDTILLDPVLRGERDLASFERSDQLMIEGAMGSASYHTAKYIAEAIRRLAAKDSKP